MLDFIRCKRRLISRMVEKTTVISHLEPVGNTPGVLEEAYRIVGRVTRLCSKQKLGTLDIPMRVYVNTVLYPNVHLTPSTEEFDEFRSTFRSSSSMEVIIERQSNDYRITFRFIQRGRRPKSFVFLYSYNSNRRPEFRFQFKKFIGN